MTVLNNTATSKSGLNEEPDGIEEPILKSEPPKGFTTKEALDRLDEDISSLLHDKESLIRSESIFGNATYFLRYSQDAPLGGFAIALTLLCIVGLVVAQHLWSAVFLTAILLLTTFIVYRESNFRRFELHRKVREVLDEIGLAKHVCSEWIDENYPNLCSPVSPCVTLQWTYRDARIVNLPWALLVRDDLIIIRPGQVAPGACETSDGRRRFDAGETYGVAHSTEPPLKPTARTPLPDMECRLLETPYLENLRTSLDKFLERPMTIYNQQRHLLVTKYIQFWGVLVSLVLSVSFGFLRHYDVLVCGGHWIDIFVLLPISAILPILPLMFPILWIAVNLWGVARLQTLLAMPRTDSQQLGDIEADDTAEQQQKQKAATFQEDLDSPTYDWEKAPLPRDAVFFHWLALWRGNSHLLGRSANVVQVLGSITALSCVDKKGILSWPNPTAEKVFFLRDSAMVAAAKATGGATGDKPNTMKSQSSMDSDSSQQKDAMGCEAGAVAEVLDLTHDQHSPFRLEFDDHAWAQHLQSLKPLGLAILVNTCCPLTQAHYAQFCNHVTAVAMLDKDLVPVTNRYEIVESRLKSFMHGRCLCELAKQIGFTTTARDIFQLEGQIASYMHVQPDVVRRDIRFARQLQLASKVKVPFPHSLSVVMRESHSNSLQLLTQGTADIVLDCCDDYWDGKDLRPLSQHERKRAQDFYQRSALTAYCTAFAYRPLRHGISGALAGVTSGNTAYLELPPEPRYTLGHTHRSSPSFTYDSTSALPPLHQSVSTDSLLFATSSSTTNTTTATANHHTVNPHEVRGCSVPASHRHPHQLHAHHHQHSHKEADCTDVEGCFEMQCHQVFIGMVTMQYQAQTDVVQLIERLEQACVRFVHFSKENELRSRVFSEKMGLESGWNCHISLLSKSTSTLPSPKTSRAGPFADIDASNNAEMSRLLPTSGGLETSRNLSSSAPGAISTPDCSLLPATTSAVQPRNQSTDDSTTDNSLSLEMQRRASKDSAMDDEHCRSLSCLTDSTEQSAPINFDMSNRAKLPRGIENIQPHLENVDNVPLLVSLFTDCSAEATREMLDIMQTYGEIVVCLGSSASNANAEIFLQADCAIGVEPLYPQVCQDIAAYTEANLEGNRWRAKTRMRERNRQDDEEKQQQRLSSDVSSSRDQLWQDAAYSSTISPIYLSRILNSIACSISICRDESLSIVSLIELSRRFSNGLWSCIQFWASCGCSLALMNTLCACLSLPPIITPLGVLYLMGVAVPMLATTLVRTDPGQQVMNRATAKKHTQFDSAVFGFVLFCYGCKFIPSTLIMILCYCTFMSHPVVVLDTTSIYDFGVGLECARAYILLAVIIHYVCISMSFVHRDFSVWRKSPASNIEWIMVALLLILVQLAVFGCDVLLLPDLSLGFHKMWPIVLFLFGSVCVVFAITEICKWEELKVNARYQRRARLDFGTKLGMNSPF